MILLEEEDDSTQGVRLDSRNKARLEESNSTRGAASLARGLVSRLVTEGLPLFRTSGLTIGPLNGVSSRRSGFSENDRQHKTTSSEDGSSS